jgi:hypothetical protein
MDTVHTKLWNSGTDGVAAASKVYIFPTDSFDAFGDISKPEPGGKPSAGLGTIIGTVIVWLESLYELPGNLAVAVRCIAIVVLN